MLCASYTHMQQARQMRWYVLAHDQAIHVCVVMCGSRMCDLQVTRACIVLDYLVSIANQLCLSTAYAWFACYVIHIAQVR